MSETSKGIGDAVAFRVTRTRTLVSGLFWQPLERPRELEREARDVGKRMKMSIVTIRRKYPITNQAGFVRRGAGVEKGQYSLAAACADMVWASGTAENNLENRSIVAAIAIGDGRYAIFAAQKKAIIPNSDLVVGSAEEARDIVNRLRLMLSQTGKAAIELPAVYAPEEIYPDPTGVITLEEIARRGAKRAHRLKQLTFGLTRKEILRFAVLAAVAAAGTAGFMAWQNHLQELQRLEEERAQAERERIKRETGMDVSKIALIQPWTLAPKAEVLVDRCNQMADATLTNVALWRLDNLLCEVSGARAVYLFQPGGTLNDFEASIRELHADARVVFNATRTEATVRHNWKLNPAGEEHLMRQEQRLKDFLSHLQLQMQQQTVSIKDQPSIAAGFSPTPPPGTQPPQPDWRTTAFSVAGYSPPDEWMKGMDLQGVRFTSIGLQLDGIKVHYTVKGEMYGG